MGPGMKFWILLFTLAVSSCLHPVLAETPATDPNPGLNFGVIETYFKPVKCFEFNFDLAMSCAEGFNSALKLLPEEHELVGASAVTTTDQILRDLGPVKLVRRVARVRPSTYQDALKVRDERLAALENGVRELVGKPAPFDYRAEIRALRPLIDANIPDSKIVLAALDGQIKSADAHGFLMTRQDFETFQGSADPGLIGVGVVLHAANRAWRFQRVIPGSGGEAAGLKNRDLLLKIDGRDVGFDWSVDEVAKALRGPEGSDVKLRIERGGQEIDVTVRRRPFRQSNLSSHYDGSTRTGILRIERFAATGDDGFPLCTEADLRLHDLAEDGAQNFVIDLRDNPGGFIDQAICLLSLFTGPDQVAVRAKAPGPTTTETVYRTQDPQKYSGTLVVLINEASASASELFAGAVQDLQRGWVVGTRSFGKGSLQDFDAFSEAPVDAVMARTVQIFYQPRGRTNQGEGIFPDIEIGADANASTEWVPREFDLYPKALKTEMKTPREWISPRPEALQNLRQCVQSQVPSPVEDLQLASALAVTACTPE